MHYTAITHAAMDRALLRTAGRTPESTMGSTLGTDIRQREARGERPRFAKLGRGMFALADPPPGDLAADIEEHNAGIRERLKERLLEGSASEFESLIATLLTEMGFEDVEVTPASGDGGIDVRGTLLVEDAVRLRMAVQAKRWKQNVQTPAVQQLRGSLGAHEQGLIITTSDFSRGARSEAARPDAAPVALVTGEQLIGLLVRHGIGVARAPYELLTLGELPDAGA